MCNIRGYFYGRVIVLRTKKDLKVYMSPVRQPLLRTLGGCLPQDKGRMIHAPAMC